MAKSNKSKINEISLWRAQDNGYFYPVILQTGPPTLLTRKEAYKKVPHMKITHIPATNPRPEDGK